MLVWSHTVVLHASKHNRPAVVQLLLRFGVDKEVKVKVKTPSELGWTPLHVAVWFGFLDVARILLNAGANIEAESDRSQRALHLACWRGHCDVVDLLLERGADIEARDKFGSRPLHLTCLAGQIEVTRKLLDRRAEIESQDNEGGRPLLWATQCDDNRLEMVRLLLENGADINARDNEGHCLMYTACVANSLVVVQLALGKGYVAIENSDGQFEPLHIAARNDQKEIVWMLARNFPLLIFKGEWSSLPRAAKRPRLNN